jgi:hypothetical protein
VSQGVCTAPVRSQGAAARHRHDQHGRVAHAPPARVAIAARHGVRRAPHLPNMRKPTGSSVGVGHHAQRGHIHGHVDALARRPRVQFRCLGRAVNEQVLHAVRTPQGRATRQKSRTSRTAAGARASCSSDAVWMARRSSSPLSERARARTAPSSLRSASPSTASISTYLHRGGSPVEVGRLRARRALPHRGPTVRYGIQYVKVKYRN